MAKLARGNRYKHCEEAVNNYKSHVTDDTLTKSQVMLYLRQMVEGNLKDLRAQVMEMKTSAPGYTVGSLISWISGEQLIISSSPSDPTTTKAAIISELKSLNTTISPAAHIPGREITARDLEDQAENIKPKQLLKLITQVQELIDKKIPLLIYKPANRSATEEAVDENFETPPSSPRKPRDREKIESEKGKPMDVIGELSNPEESFLGSFFE
jgi:hypothetical protein